METMVIIISVVIKDVTHETESLYETVFVLIFFRAGTLNTLSNAVDNQVCSKWRHMHEVQT